MTTAVDVATLPAPPLASAEVSLPAPSPPPPAEAPEASASVDAGSAIDDTDPASGADGARGSGDGGRTRWRVTTQETSVLEAVFASSPRPNKNTIHQLATMLGVKPRQVQVWFQNRRQRWRKDFLELEKARSLQMAELSGKVIDFHGDLLPPLTSASSAAVAMPPGWEHLIASTIGVGAGAPAAAAPAAAALTAMPAIGLPVSMPTATTTPMHIAATPSTQAAAALAAALAAPAAMSARATAAITSSPESMSGKGAMPAATAAVVTPASVTASATHASTNAADDTTFDAFDLCDLLQFPEAAASVSASATAAGAPASATPPPPVLSPFGKDAHAESDMPPLGAPLISRTHTNVTSSNSDGATTAANDSGSDDADDTIWLGMEWLLDGDELTAHA